MNFEAYNYAYHLATFGNIPYHFQKLILKNKKIDSKDTILVVGTPRSGTTWLLELLDTLPRYTYQNEPLNGTMFPEAKKAGFKSRGTYKPPEQDWIEGEKYLQKVFTGKATGLIFHYRWNPKSIISFLSADKLIIKFVRLNRLLPWVIKRFQVRHIYFIIRHPCAVIASQLKTGFHGYERPTPPLRDITLTAERIIREASEIQGIESQLLKKIQKIEKMDEILAVALGLDHLFLNDFKKPANWTTIVYEKLLTIVIPCKNEEDYIPHLLDNLQSQKGIEQVKIYIADASTDNTRNKIVEHTGSLDVTIIQGGPVSKAKNNGAQLAETPYLLFIDADVRFFVC